jgi:cell volume regulation protein A
VAHGSGFLAVFAAGVAVGDERAPYKREIERFHGALASLSEIVAFVVLGLQVDARTVLTPQVWVPGVVAAAVLAAAARPAVVAACLARAGISTREKAFVAFAGLKGAVPILLATMIFGGGVPGASRLYGIVVVAVVLSVLVQGTLTPVVARWLSVHMRTVEPEPWALGMRLRHEPRGVHRIRVREGASAVGSRLGDVGLGDDVWVSFAVRGGRLLPVAGETTFQPGDELLVLAPPDKQEELQKAFTDR